MAANQFVNKRKLDWTVLPIHHKVKIWPAKDQFRPDQFRENGEFIKEVKMWF